METEILNTLGSHVVKHFNFDQPRSGVVYNIGPVCMYMYVCLSDDNFRMQDVYIRTSDISRGNTDQVRI